MQKDIADYHNKLAASDKLICDELYELIAKNIPQAEGKVWHAHPVWFVDGNPLVGYSKLKDSVRLLFWSGQSFDEPLLLPEGSFKAADISYTDVGGINEKELTRYLHKAVDIQWDYKNLIKNRELLRLK